MLDPADLLPADYLAAYNQTPPPPIVNGGPLPDVVAHHYTSGGCFTLAIALHLATDLPIELYWQNGAPRHAFVTDGITAFDAVGARPLSAARAGAERSEQLELADLLALLPSVKNGDLILKDIRRRASQVAAERTAAAIIEAVAWERRR